MKDSSNKTEFEDVDEELAFLLAGEALGDLDNTETLRLEELSAAVPQLDARRESLRRVADSIGSVSDELQDEMPSSEGGIQMSLNPKLSEKIRRDAMDYFSVNEVERPTSGQVSFWTSPWLGWCVAASLGLLCTSLWFSQNRGPSSNEVAWVSSEQAARTWMQVHPNAIAVKWDVKDPSIVASGTEPGRVVWDPDSQSGFMSLNTLPVNDSAVQQYQLWIIDPKRDDEPIDGGVFDIVRSGQSIIPIRAKLDVIDPVGFAVTVEKPGGVVVSDQSRLPLLAMVPK